jgi:hypothetical protein
MDAVLLSLLAVEGVTAIVVADRTGQVLASRAKADFDAVAIDEVGRTAMASLDSVENLYPDWESVTARFAEGQIILRHLGTAGAPSAAAKTLAVVADKRFQGLAAQAALTKAVAELKALAARPAVTPPQRGSAPEIVAHELSPAVAAEIEQYLEDLANATLSTNAVPEFR